MPAKLNAPSAEETAQKVRFGNFEIVNDPEGRPLSLGKGTFGRTYQARHSYLETIVALKIITERYATDAAVRQRFLTEARAVAKLSHPHIARLYDFGEMDGVLHYAMEYCAGGSLADHVAKHGPLPLRQLLEVGQQIAGALKCAHAAGFIHRDLKPSNIMLTGAEGPLFAKLIDFGLVQPSVPGATRSIGDDQSADGARFLGTPLFASPEQLREEPMDVRTDLFSLGVTLWYLLLGGPPETGSSAAIAASRLSAESYAARLPANVVPQFRDVLVRLLEKDRNKRFGSAAEVFNAFNLCAAALGFRRAKDYTDATSGVGEWEEDGAIAEPQKSAEPEPIEVENIEAALDSEFRIITRINEDFTGLNYIAEPRGAPERLAILHVLHPVLLDDQSALERFRVHIAQLVALDLPEVLCPKSMRAFSDYVCVVFDKPADSDLMSVLRTGRGVHLIEAAPLLETIADACDRLSAAGLPGAQLAPGHIFIEWVDDAGSGAKSTKELSKARPKLYPRFLAVSEAPELARLNEPEDVSSTMTTDMLGDPGRADNMSEHFATLLYRMVAGRNCPIAAAFSSQGYVAIPGLSEQSNRFLSLVIAKQIENVSCGQVLRDVLGAEGIVPRVPGHPTAGFTARAGSTVTPVAGTPAMTPRSVATPPVAPAKQPTSARTWRPPTVGTAITPTPPVAKQSPRFAAVTPTPPPVTAPPLPVTPPPAPGFDSTSLPVIDTPKAPITPPAEPTVKETSAPTPAEARAKDFVPAPEAKSAPKKTVSEPEMDRSETPATKAPAVAKEKADAETKFEPVTPPRTSTKPPRVDIADLASPPVIDIPKAPVTPPAEPTVKEMATPVPAEARTKDSVSAPEAKSPPKKTVSKPARERIETAATQAPAVAKEKGDGETKTEPTPPRIPAKPPRVEEKILVPAENKKGDRPPTVPKAPVVLPTPPRPAVISKRETDAAETKFRVLWQDPKIRWIGIGIAALLLISVSYATFHKSPGPRVATVKPSNVVPTPATSVPSPAVAVNKPSPPPPRPSVAGHYVGQVRGREASGSGSMTFDREISIDAGLTGGYLVDYGSDPTKQIQFADGQVAPDGVYTARAAFSSAMGAAHNDENLTVRRGDKGLEVSFKGRQTSGAEYMLEGVLHTWTEADQTRYRDLVAEAAQKQNAAEAAKRVAAAPFTPPSNPEIAAKAQTQDKGQSNAKASRRTASATESATKASGGEHQTTRSHASEVAARPPVAPAAPPATRTATRPAPPPKPAGEPQQRRHQEFEGSAPGG